MLPPRTDKPGERRAAERRACHQPCLVRFDRRYLDGWPGSVGAEGSLSDLSACRLGLLLRPAVAPGATLAVGPLGSEAPMLPPARVVRCVPAGRLRRYGCALGRRLSEEELRAWLA
jgi:hypothetical protein